MSGTASEIATRLKTTCGHLDAICRMIAEDAPWSAVGHQLSAVQGSLAALQRCILELRLREDFAQFSAECPTGDLVDLVFEAAFGTTRTPLRPSKPENLDTTDTTKEIL